MNLRQGNTIGHRLVGTADQLISCPMDELAAVIQRASRADLISAHRYCERNVAGNRQRRAMLARALRFIVHCDDLDRRRARRAQLEARHKGVRV